jgi:hypothetical protein
VSGAAFYCVADERYFLGAVGLVNSLRLVGHREPIFMLDCGLADEQRALLEPEVSVEDGPRDAPPWLLKTIVPLRRRADPSILIDADMIATRPLSDLVETAAAGRVVTFRNDTERFVPEWGELLGLGTARRRPYVSSGLILLGGRVGEAVLGLMDDRQRRVDVERTFARGHDDDYPFLYPEQDVLNAILATHPEPARLVTLDNRLAPNPPYRGLRILDEERLRCAHPDGTEPYVLHQFVRKPWLEPMYHGIYSHLLARLLLGADLAIRVPTELVPVRMRSGPRARVERIAVNAFDLGRWYLAERLPAWSRRRLGTLRQNAGTGRR